MVGILKRKAPNLPYAPALNPGCALHAQNSVVVSQGSLQCAHRARLLAAVAFGMSAGLGSRVWGIGFGV